MQRLWLLLLLLPVFLSCDKQKVFEQFVQVPGDIWNVDNLIHFDVSIADTGLFHNILLEVRHTARYEFSNLYLFVTTQSPSGSIERDTVELILADDMGNWLGKGAASVFLVEYPFRKNIRFPYRGIYSFDIEQAMRVTDLQHICDVGLRVEITGRNP